jgi:N utilization substance protein A
VVYYRAQKEEYLYEKWGGPTFLLCSLWQRFGLRMKNEFLIAITQICAEKNLPREVVLEAVQAALASAYKRTFGAGQNIHVRVMPNTGEVKVYVQKTVVEEVTDPKTQISLAEAQSVQKDAQPGQVLEFENTPHDFGRIAAQTAKQVVLQRLREAEREAVFDEFVGREGDVVSGLVRRIEPKHVIIDLGKAEAILPASEQLPTERYRPGQRIKAFLLEVQRTNRGPILTVSRTHRNLLRRLLELEVPEIYSGIVELKSISREPGSRSKVAVAALQNGVDPVGSCVGMRGVRIQNVVNELNGEKIDVVQWDENPAVFVANALSPAQVVNVTINEQDRVATVVVPDRQLSLAIGKDGQNARLAARLTGWKIDIKSASMAKAEEEARRAAEEAEAQQALAEAELPAPEAEVPTPAAAEPIPTSVAGVDTTPPPVELPDLEEALPAIGEEEEAIPAEEPVPVSEFPWPPLEEPTEGPAEKPQIRFAEDLLVAPLRVDKKGKKLKGKRAHEEEAPRKKVRKARPYYEEDLEEYDFQIK